MLALPIARPDSSNLFDPTPFAQFLSKQQVPEHNIKNDLEALTTIRNNAISVSEFSEFGQQQLLRYIYHLKMFIPRLAGIENDIKLMLVWTDAFVSNKKTNPSLSTFYLDWACCLWNLGAFESSQGSRIDRSTEDGIRTASKHFQLAAGYFDFIRENLLASLRGVTIPCLSEESLQMAKQLMLAQAQLCFYEKAVKDKKKDSMKSGIIAKLAIQTSTFYKSASVSCKIGSLATALDNSWFSITDFQAKCFHGAAEYWQANAVKETALQRGSGYGEEVTRLNRAEISTRQAIQTISQAKLASTLSQGAEGLLQVIISLKATAIHDLNTVYMESVPPDSSLSEITGVVMVKSANVFDNDVKEKPLFGELMPKAVINANIQFFEEVTNIFVISSSEADNASNIARSTLSSVGLPGSLEAVKSDIALPENLWLKIARTQSMGGLAALNSMLDDIENSAKRALLSLSNIDECLDREERIDDSFRLRYSDYNATTKSSVLCADIKMNNQRMRDAFNNARSNDTLIMNSLRDNETIASFQILYQSREQILTLFPKAPPNLLDFDEHIDSQAKLIPEIIPLEESLLELAGIIEERSKYVDSLKSITIQDFSELIATAITSTTNPSTVSLPTVPAGVIALHSEYLSKCEVIRQDIVDGVKKQEELLKRILELNETFNKNKDTNPLAVERNKIILMLEQNVAKFFGLHSQLSAGNTFYANVQSKLTSLQQSADDLAYTQQWQRQEYENNKNFEFQRKSQENQDREYALKLMNEMNQPPATPKPNSSNGANSDIYYGQPVGGPPPNSNIIYQTPQNNVNIAPPPMNPAVANNQPNPVNQLVINPTNNGAPILYQQQSNPYIIPQVNGAYAQPSYGYGQQPVNSPPIPQQYNQVQSSYSGYPGVNLVNQQAIPNIQQLYHTNNYGAQPPGGYPSQLYQQQSTAPTVEQVPVNQHNQNPLVVDRETKINRLCEMGFPRENVIAALTANDNDEGASLNSLLSSAAAVPPKPSKPSGLFSSWTN
eukprot:gene9367-12620_t